MANTKEYIAIIADAYESDIESSAELVQLHKNDALPENSSVFRFTLDTDTPELPALVAQGYFFENDWSADGTVSYVGPVSEVE